MQHAKRDERVTFAQLPLHAKRHHHASVEHHSLRQTGLVLRDLGVAGREFLVDAPDRSQKGGKASLTRRPYGRIP